MEKEPEIVAHTSYHHGDLRRALIQEALRVLEESGAPAISLRAVAKAVGVSPNAPYRHFVDKSVLMADLCAEGFFRLLTAFETLERSSNPRAHLIALCAAYVGFAVNNPALYRLMFSAYGYGLESEYCRTAGLQAFGALVSSVEELHAAGWKPASNSGDLTMTIWAFLHGWAGICIDSLVPVPAAYPLSDSVFGSRALERALDAIIGPRD